MKIRMQGKVFVADSSFEERLILKAAGWWWHGGGCRPKCAACAAGVALKVWWTSRPEQTAKLLEYCDEAAKLAAGVAAESLEQSRATDVAPEVAADLPVPAGLAYLGYQRAGIAYALKRKGTLMADAMGLGKTIQAIGVINADPTIKTVLVIAPASLRLNWRREMTKWLVRPMTIEIVDSASPPAAESQIVVTNYERIRSSEKRPSEVLAALMARQWDLLVVDEAHRSKNRKAQQTQAILGGSPRKGAPREPGLIDRAGRYLFLTGTPLPNGRPIEIHPLLQVLDPGAFGNFFSFAKRYCGAHQKRAGRKMVWDFSGSTNLTELQDRMRATVMVRRLKEDVLTELPAKRRQIVVLPCNGGSRAVADELDAYDRYSEDIADAEVARDLAEPDSDEYRAAAGRLHKLRAVAFAEMSAMRKAVALAKVEKVLEHVDAGLEEQGKCILFCHHHAVTDQFAAHWGAEAVIVDGRTSAEDRQAAVDRFQADPSCKVFVGSITAAGVGITLTASSWVVFAELSHVPSDLSQAEDRAHRIGKTASVLVQHLVLDSSLDSMMIDELIEKQANVDAALDTQVAAVALEAAKDKTATAKREQAEKPLPAGLAEAVHEGLRFLAARCDGAAKEDSMGFNKVDSAFGKKLAALPALSYRAVLAGQRLLIKYTKRQLPETISAAIRGQE